MKTEKQKELIHSFLSTLGDETKPIYEELILYLSELGYIPQKQKSAISFKHDLHTKQIAKIGVKSRIPYPFFALRFSACEGYSQRFADIVGAAISKYPKRAAICISGPCRCCAGPPSTHVYSYTFPDGECKTYCGAYALEIPGIAAGDIAEIKKLINEEHEYLVMHEANRE